MPSLPQNQDKLLKELNDIDVQERLGRLPEKSNLNLILLSGIWAFAIIISIILVSRGDANYISNILLVCMGVSVGLIGAFYNKTWGYLISCIAALIGNIYITRLDAEYFSHVITLIDSFTIFIFANTFNKWGYFTGVTLTIAKLVIIHFGINKFTNIEDPVASLIIASVIGAVPILLTSFAKISRRARKQEIRSEILALQNQDLLNSWQQFYQSPVK